MSTEMVYGIDVVGEAPPQFGVGEACSARAGGCGKPLSRYNPFAVCSACRIRISLGAEASVKWPTRVAVRRGALGIN